jgi:hypothetical protein
MKKVSRRNLLKLASATAASAALPHESMEESVAEKHDAVLQWECFEAVLQGPSSGNPFVDVQLAAIFSLGHREVRVDGFYDGDGTFRIRFMPDAQGIWHYRTISNSPALDNHKGAFEAVTPQSGCHGPVGVCNTYHFAYADGAPFFPFGTTCYAWIHQSELLQQQTLASLKASPFNKLRMCVFPKHYEYNHNEPELYPFVRDSAGKSDWARFNPAFFAHLERRISDLRGIGVEADLILFHPYDRWGYSSMPADADDRYLRYLMARLSAYPNIWWSLANEFDLMKSKSVQDFDRFFRIVEQYDPYAHLRSVHYSRTMYDYGRPWVTHTSLQSADFAAAPGFRSAWKKPVCYDEVQYEGNLNSRWGNLAGDELSRRFWLGVISGCYVTHGETYLIGTESFDVDSTSTLWWAHGGTLHGTSPKQIAFLHKLLEDTISPSIRIGLQPQENPYYLNAATIDAKTGRVAAVLYYFDYHQPIWYDFPLPDGTFAAELIDPALGTFNRLNGTYSGKVKLTLTGKPYQAVRFMGA